MTGWQNFYSKRNRWVAAILTQICPGWGQIYNRDWIGLVAVLIISAVAGVLFEIYLFDTLEKLLWAVGAGLLLSTAFSVQAFFKAKQVKEVHKDLRQLTWWYFLVRVVFVYLLSGVLIYGFPDCYGKLFPSRINSFVIPSESMVPNLLVGDRLVADGWAYWHSDPVRGDIIVFDWPKDPTIKFVKRLIGLPGDKIEMKLGELYVNDSLVPQARTPTPLIKEGGWVAAEYMERLGNIDHTIHRSQPENDMNFGPVTVPQGEFFMMGDNRDRSNDSRSWGFVKRDALIGRMKYIFFSWDAEIFKLRQEQDPADIISAIKAAIRWDRLGKQVM